ncbi:MAG: ABC transporter ATP-binding protein [Elusimicrobiales bacterium]
MKQTIARLLPYLRPHRRRLMQASLAMTATAAINGGASLLLKPVVDGFSSFRDQKQLFVIVILLPAIFLLKLLFQYTQGYLMSFISQKIVQQIREDLFRHLHKLSVEFYWRKRSAEVMTRVTSDLTNLQSALQFLPLYSVRDTFTVMAVFAVLLYINWRFTLIALLVGPLAGVVIGVLGRKMRQSSGRSQAIIGQIYHRFSESLEGMTIVKAFNYEEGAIAKFCQQNDALFAQIMRYLRATALSGPLLEFLGSLVIALLIWVGGREILAHRMTAGDFAVFLGAFFMAYGPLKNLAQANSTFQLGYVSWSRILQLLDEKPHVAEPENPVPVDRLEGDIVFENVSYGYPNGAPVIKRLNLHIKPGQAVAFVGASGSGKTTLINLLLRLFDPAEGRILYDGKDLRAVDLRGLRSHIGLVSQNTILFDDTVSANVALGDGAAAESDIIAACEAADAHEFIAKMPCGYKTMLGERGVKLSGGQRQRLAIARALLKKPSVLLLDEATSNLDTESEKSVQTALERIMKQRTVIMVAHRLSTIAGADKICVLHRGEIAETGTHDELLAKCGIYARLCEIQKMAPAAE